MQYMSVLIFVYIIFLCNCLCFFFFEFSVYLNEKSFQTYDNLLFVLFLADDAISNLAKRPYKE